MGLIDDLLNDLPDGETENVIIGLHWTAVSVRVNGSRLCGLSSTVSSPHGHGQGYDVPEAGSLTQYRAGALAQMCQSEQPALASVGTAALNALLQVQTLEHQQKNAEDLIVEFGAGQHVAIIGHFPFTDRIRQIAGRLDVLENRPQPGDVHASLAPEILPQARVVAITGMAFVNRTLKGLLALCNPDATVIVLGASTPLHPVLFEYGVDYLCGALTSNIDAVMRTTAEGAVYRQIAKSGLRLVTIQKT